MKRSPEDARKLLLKALDASLTAAERTQLQQYQTSREGQDYLATHYQLGEYAGFCDECS